MRRLLAREVERCGSARSEALRIRVEAGNAHLSLSMQLAELRRVHEVHASSAAFKLQRAAQEHEAVRARLVAAERQQGYHAGEAARARAEAAELQARLEAAEAKLEMLRVGKRSGAEASSREVQRAANAKNPEMPSHREKRILQLSRGGLSNSKGARPTPR
jgi:hypothetical protein